MFKHLLPERGILLNEPATVPRQQLEADEGRIGFVLQQAEAVDRTAMDCKEVGVVGFVAGISRLAKLFGGVGVKDANLDPRLGESSLDGAMVASRPLDDRDQVFDAMPRHGVAHPLQRCLEASLVVLNDGRLQKDSTVEVSEHHLGASLGAIDAEKGEMFWTDRLDSWMNHATRLVNAVRSGLARTL